MILGYKKSRLRAVQKKKMWRRGAANIICALTLDEGEADDRSYRDCRVTDRLADMTLSDILLPCRPSSLGRHQ